MTSPDDLERDHPHFPALPVHSYFRRRLTMGSILNVLHLFISLEMPGNVFDNFVFFLANTQHLLLE